MPALHCVVQMEFNCTGKTIPGLFMLVFGALTFLLDSVFGVFLIILVPVLAVDQGTPTLHKNLYERYRKFRERFQKKHPIRIAIAGGL